MKTTTHVHVHCKFEPHTNSGTKLCSNLKLNILVKIKLENDYSKLVLVPTLEADFTQNCAVMNAWLGLINQLFF